MRILICDDDQTTAGQLAGYIRDFFKRDHLKCPDMDLFFDGESLLADPGEKDIVFLDVEMPGVDGIYVGQQLKKEAAGHHHFYGDFLHGIPGRGDAVSCFPLSLQAHRPQAAFPQSEGRAQAVQLRLRKSRDRDETGRIYGSCFRHHLPGNAGAEACDPHADKRF